MRNFSKLDNTRQLMTDITEKLQPKQQFMPLRSQDWNLCILVKGVKNTKIPSLSSASDHSDPDYRVVTTKSLLFFFVLLPGPMLPRQ